MSALNLPVVSDSFEHYMKQISRFDILDRQQEVELAYRYRRNGDLDAAHRLICANLRFVVKVANEYRQYGLRIQDLVQEGNIGLMLAVKKFDPERGIRLISYAVWWIRAYITNFILRSWSMVKIGTTQAQKKLFFKLNRARAAMFSLTGRDDTEEIARDLDVSDHEVEEMAMRMSSRDASLDVELFPGEDYTLLDSLADTRQNQEELLLDRETVTHLRERISRAMSVLNEREQDIINRRIVNDSPETLQEIADGYGISRERVRQIERNALDKLKEML